MTEYTEDEIALACAKNVEDWNIEMLVDCAVEGMVFFYLYEASDDQLDEFMREND